MANKARMPFGKYKGDLIADIPSSYIVWLLDHAGEQPLPPVVARAVALELFQRLVLPFVKINLHEHVSPRTGRTAADPDGVFDMPTAERVTFKSSPEMKPTRPSINADPALARDVIDAGYKALARRAHPDAGGSTEEFQRLTVTVEALRNSLPRPR